MSTSEKEVKKQVPSKQAKLVMKETSYTTYIG